MGISRKIATAALLIASAIWSDAFTPASFVRYSASTNCDHTEYSSASKTFLRASNPDSEGTPCEAPSDVEAVVLDDAGALRNALVTNIKGERVALGDAMTSKTLSEKTFDTSVVVFLRHMG